MLTKPNLHHFCTTFDSCDVIEMKEMREEVGKKTPQKRDGKSLIFMTSQESKVEQSGADWASSKILSGYARILHIIHLWRRHQQIFIPDFLIVNLSFFCQLSIVPITKYTIVNVCVLLFNKMINN